MVCGCFAKAPGESDTSKDPCSPFRQINQCGSRLTLTHTHTHRQRETHIYTQTGPAAHKRWISLIGPRHSLGESRSIGPLHEIKHSLCSQSSSLPCSQSLPSNLPRSQSPLGSRPHSQLPLSCRTLDTLSMSVQLPKASAES